jgi:hypothetical protein
MALSNKPRGRWWSRLHFLIRFLGLTAVLVAGVGLAIAWRKGALVAFEQAQSWEQVQAAAQATHDDLRHAMHGLAGQKREIFAVVMTSCALLMILAFLVECLPILVRVSGRRSAFGFNAVVQIALAMALLIGVNVYSFTHGRRFDWTSNQQFTLPEDVSEQLRQLQSDTPTTIVVYQFHKTFGQNKDEKPDAFDGAAERKVIEKVKDLVDQFREFGPRFKVEVLDVDEENFNDRIEAVTARIAKEFVRDAGAERRYVLAQAIAPQAVAPSGAPAGELPQAIVALGLGTYDPFTPAVERKAKELRATIESAPENSIFFFGGGKVQSLTFNDFYQLNKTASQDRGNLVLLNQGVKPFADKVLNVQEKRPKIGIAVIHEWLTATEGYRDYGLAGLKKALTARGFDVQDVILKKWSRFAPPAPAVYSIDESKLDRLEERTAILDRNITTLETARKKMEQVRKQWRTASLEELTKEYAEQLRGRKVTESMRKNELEGIEEELEDLQAALDDQRKRRNASQEEQGKLNLDDLAEQRRLADLRAKFDRLLADCDLLIVPRMTLRNVNAEDAITPSLYRLDEAQVSAIKDFLKAGKPVLACFGPTIGAPDRPAPDAAGPDGLEELFAQLGVKFGKQTVLFDVESESFAEQRLNPLATGASVEVPALDFDWKPGVGRPPLLRSAGQGTRRVNPLRESLRVAELGLGKDKDGIKRRLELRLRHPRPVYFESSADKPPAFDPEFLMTSPASWNEDQPFPTQERIPHYERDKKDPDKGTLDEKRRGPFPIGVAVETTLPSSWYDNSKAAPAKVRVAAIGHGGFFAGAELPPAQEKLLLNTCNWLLGRDEYLPKADKEWSYPRVTLEERDKDLWRWGAQVALPLVFAYLGVVVLLVRRLR